MKALLIKAGAFVLTSIVLYSCFSFFALPVLLEAAFGMSVEDQIDKSFKNAREREYDILVTGNSKFYCGVNPDYFSKPAFNFSHNNDNYNQIYHKLVWLEKEGKKFKHVILGTDFFQFGFISDTRNYAYQKYFDADYLRDYPAEKLSFGLFKKKFGFLKPYKLKTLLQVPYIRHDLKDNGQFVRRGSPGEDDFIKRKFSFMDVQVRYFDRILEHCSERGIQVYIVIPPMRENEYTQFTKAQIQEFNTFLEKRLTTSVRLLDFSTNEKFGTSDFIDMAHLSQQGAIYFTELLNKSLHRETSRAILSN